VPGGCLVHFLPVTAIGVELGQKATNVFTPKPTVAAPCNTVSLQYPPVTPPSYRIRVDMKELGHFPYCQHGPHLPVIYHTFLSLTTLKLTLLDDNSVKLVQTITQIG
jgi:hypothetical protein